MQFYIMDSDYEVMKTLDTLINSYPKYNAKCYTSSQALVKSLNNEPPDAVMIDFDIQNSISLIKSIKSKCPNTKIVIMSEDKNKAIEVFELGLNGFLKKPLDDEKVNQQLFRLQHPILSKIKINKERSSAQ